MKKLFSALWALLALSGSALADDQLAISFKADGTAPSFSFQIATTEETQIKVDCGYGPVTYDVSPSFWSDENQTIISTVVPITLSESKEVKVYGDPSLINYFFSQGGYIESIDLGQCYNLQILDLSHNVLKALDLSPYTLLQAIYLTDNPFSAETPLVVGDNHPDLQILEVDIVDYISPDFDINTFTNLKSFDAYANKTLSHLDPTNCPGLMRLSVDMCPIESLDVTQNTELVVLNIEDTKITTIDLTHCSKLQQLYARHESGWVNRAYKMTNLDLSGNPELTYLTAGGNLLTSIDLAPCPKLSYVILSNNLLSAIDISNNPLISTLNITDNNMSFATLPLPSNDFYEYTYKQRALPTERSYAEGTVLDFSDKVLREGSTTSCTLYSYNVAGDVYTQLDNSYFSYADGRVTLLKAHRDSLVVSFANPLFPDATHETQKFMVKTAEKYGQPSKILSFTIGKYTGDNFSLHVGLYGASEENPLPFTVIAGNNSFSGIATTASTPAEPNVNCTMGVGSNLEIYVPEGSVLTAFKMDGIPVYSSTLSAATEIRELTISNADLYNINLDYCRCLTDLDLSYNNLSSLDLKGINESYGKNVLFNVNASHNKLSEIEFTSSLTLVNLDLSYNQFEEFNFKDFDNLQSINIAGNKIPFLNMAYFENVKYCDVSDNLFTFLELPENNVFEYLNVSNNQLTFASLPYLAPREGLEYVTAPQDPIAIATRGPGIDLSAQDLNIAGHQTSFVWKKQDGTPLVKDVDYSISGGRTKFLNTEVGKIYCEMTNGAFPGFVGENALRTTLIKADKKPTNLLATFETPVGNEAVSLSLAGNVEGSAVYFDWEGNNDFFQQYLLKSAYTLYNAKTTAGATVKAYTYEPEEKVTIFSISNCTMESCDLTNLDGVQCLSLINATLPEITFPENTADLTEINLDRNLLESFDVSKFPAVKALAVSNNNLTSIDVSSASDLQVLNASMNQISSVNLGSNSNLWLLNLAANGLESIDLSTLPGLEQISLSNNYLSEIDLSANNNIAVLQLDGNMFDFTTLPRPNSNWYVYSYSNQYPLLVESVGNKVDLSSQARVDDTETQFVWYQGVPEYNEFGELTGTTLVEGQDYTIDNGVTTFLHSFNEVMCILTNSVFPNMFLYTPLLSTSGVDSIVDDNVQENNTIFNLQGVPCNKATEPGIYIINGKKILVK